MTEWAQRDKLVYEPPTTEFTVVLGLIINRMVVITSIECGKWIMKILDKSLIRLLKNTVNQMYWYGSGKSMRTFDVCCLPSFRRIT